MGKLFDYDGIFMTVVNRFASLIWLGILTLVFCIPVITAGASFTAMHYAVFKLRDGDSGYVTQNFMHSFKMNIKQSTILWIIVALIGVVLYADFLILFRSTYDFSIVLKVFTGLIAFIYSLTVVFVFPLQAKFDNTVKQTLKNSFLMGMFHLPKTILMIFLHVFPFVMLFVYPVIYPAVLVLGITLPAFFNTALLMGIFKKYMPQDEAEQTDVDEEVSSGEEEFD